MQVRARPALIERETELAQLGAALDDADEGPGSLVFVEGPAGIGKSRLVEAAADLARARGMDVLSARGGELERSFSFGLVRQLFDPVVAGMSPRERADVLGGAASLAGALLELGDVAAVDRPVGDRFALFHGLYWLTSNLAARRPLLLVVDDAHWGDVASLEWMQHLARRLRDVPAALVVMARPREPDAPQALLEALAAREADRTLTLEGLSPRGAERLVEDELGIPAPAAFARACHEATGGNPFFLRALVRALEHDAVVPSSESAALVRRQGPSSISRAVFLRLQRLPGEATTVARAVAVLGRVAHVRHVAALSGLAEDEAAATAISLAGIDVLTGGAPLEFVHPVVRRAIYADLAPVERSLLHVRAARLLAEANEPHEVVASQLLAAEPGGDPWTVEALRRASDDAFASGAFPAAVEYLTRALEEPPQADIRGRVLAALGQAELIAAPAGAVEHLTAAVEAESDPRRHVDALHLLGQATAVTGRVDEALEIHERAAAAAAGVDQALAADLGFEAMAIALLSPTRAAEARAGMKQLAAPLEGVTLSECCLLGWLAWAATLDGEPAPVLVDLCERALHSGLLADAIGTTAGRRAMVPHISAVFGLICCDDFALAEQCARRALERARQRAVPIPFVAMCQMLMHTNARGGVLWRAEAYARDGCRAAADNDVQMFLPGTVALLIEVLVERGSLEEAEALLDEYGLQGDAIGNSVQHGAYEGRGILRVAQGRLREGLDDILEAGRRDRALAPRAIHACWRSRAALVHAALGERDEAKALAEEELERARAFGAPRLLGIALRRAGLIRGGDAGLELLHEAVAVLEPSQARLELSRSLVELGAALRRANHRADARGHLRRGLDFAHECGAAPLEERALVELRATGARPRRTQLTGLDALTATERRVADLAAGGMTNREIAQVQFVSARTVETHLQHVFQKLDLTSRKQLGARLAGDG